MKTVMFAGLEWQVLNEETGLVCTKDIVYAMKFGATNTWETSYVQKYLNSVLLSNFRTFERNAMIGDSIRLLTKEEAEKIDEDDRLKNYKGKLHSYYLMTPYSEKTQDFYYIYCIERDGSISPVYVEDNWYGVLPTLNLKPEFFKEYKKQIREEKISKLIQDQSQSVETGKKLTEVKNFINQTETKSFNQILEENLQEEIKLLGEKVKHTRVYGNPSEYRNLILAYSEIVSLYMTTCDYLSSR